MADPDATEAARAMNRVRWGDRVVRRAAVTLLERAEVTESTRAELEQIAIAEQEDPDD